MSEDGAGSLGVDTPDAYSSVFAIPGGQSFFPNKVALQECLGSLQNFNPGLLVAEEARHGVSMATDPDRFVLAHNELIADYGARIESMYPSVMEETVSALAKYLGRHGGEESVQQWAESLLSRASGLTGVYVADHLRTSVLGDMKSPSRSINVNSVFALMDQAQADEIVRAGVLPHEIIHLVSTGAVKKDAVTFTSKGIDMGTYDWPVRTGISVYVPQGDSFPQESPEFLHTGEWLNEAATEDLRTKVTDEKRVAYPRGVVLLRALKDCDPTLEAAIEEAMFSAKGPGATIGKVETLLGPLGMEVIEPYVSEKVWDTATQTVQPKYNDDQFLDKAVTMVPEGDLREKFRASFLRHKAEVVPLVQIPHNLESMH